MKIYNLNDKLSFGKYRNKSIQTVLENDAKYIFWCIKNLNNFSLSTQALDFAISVDDIFLEAKETTGSKNPFKNNYDNSFQATNIRKVYLMYLHKCAEDINFIAINKKTTQLTLW